MTDYRYILLVITFIIIIWYLIPHTEPEYIHYQDQIVFDGDERIIVPQNLYDKFVDILLDYVYKATDKSTRTLYIYMATYNIIFYNFHEKRLIALNNHLTGARIVREDIYYPTFAKYPNIQAVIGNLVGRDLTDTERMFTGNRMEDRKMVDVYLSTLFDLIGIIRI